LRSQFLRPIRETRSERRFTGIDRAGRQLEDAAADAMLVLPEEHDAFVRRQREDNAEPADSRTK